MYNKTQLNPEKEFERHVFHRDQFAHYLRWTHVLKTAKIGMKILDVGCANANLFEVLYRNRYRPQKYLGLDVRKQTINKLKEKYKSLEFAQFETIDACDNFDFGTDWDIITCFEVIEHIGKHNAAGLLENIKNHMSPRTILLLSTPVYDERVGAAANHIIDGKIGEFEFNELESLLKQYFKIDDVFGTFASQRDYKPHMNEWQQNMYNHLVKYYDSNLISNIMAPFFPEYSRNCLWRMHARDI